MNKKNPNEILFSKKIEEKILKIVSEISQSYEEQEVISHIKKYPLPSKKNIINILLDLLKIVYPGYFINKDLNNANINYFIGDKVSTVFERLCDEIAKSFRHEHIIKDNVCELCDESEERGVDASIYVLENIPEIRRKLAFDVKAAYEGDPAAIYYDEIVFSYPGLLAISIHRLAHLLYEKKIPLIPRIMSEYSHSITGIDIHPGARIGENFFIDHGTGVVIGETCIIGDNVKIYQGVTLGALSFPKDDKGNLLKGLQRHPVIEDNVTIYSGATILGGKTVIGKNSIIGGNVWIISSIPPNSTVTLADAENKIVIKTNIKPKRKD